MRPCGTAVCVDHPKFSHTMACIEPCLEVLVVRKAGRRHFDDQVPLAAVEMDETRRFAEQGLGKNRHIRFQHKRIAQSRRRFDGNCQMGGSAREIATVSADLMRSCATPLAAIITISPSTSSNLSSSWMTPAAIIRLMASTVKALRGKPSAAVVTATFMAATLLRPQKYSTRGGSARRPGAARLYRNNGAGTAPRPALGVMAGPKRVGTGNSTIRSSSVLFSSCSLSSAAFRATISFWLVW